MKLSVRTIQPADATVAVTQSDVPQKLLTPEEVATLLGIPRLTVVRASRAGRIPAIRVGKVYRYRPSTIAGWQREQDRRSTVCAERAR